MKIHGQSVTFDSDFTVKFHRTLRIPEDGKEHALPASHGTFPIKRVEDYPDTVPAAWLKHGGVFICMYQREAMWMSFNANKPVAVKVAAGKVNAVSGKPWSVELKPKSSVASRRDPEQDYFVTHGGYGYKDKGTSQPWLDGFNTSKGTVNQFVAMPLGGGYTVEAQVTGKEDVGGIQIVTFPAKKGAIPEPRVDTLAYHSRGLGSALEASSYELYESSVTRSCFGPAAAKGVEMGLAAGGEISQKIYESEYDVDVWDQSAPEKVFVHIVNSTMYREITGEEPPPCPITRKEYERAGYNWYELYDENAKAVGGSGTLAGVKTISEIDSDKNLTCQQDDSTLNEKVSVKIPWNPPKLNKNEITNGDW